MNSPEVNSSNQPADRSSSVRILLLAVCFVVFAIVFRAIFKDKKNEIVIERVHGKAMGTSWTIAFPKPGISPTDRKLVELGVGQILERIEDQMSTYRSDSEIVRFNQSENTDAFEVSAEFWEVMKFALEVADQTEGRFDPTVGPLVSRWGFGKKKETDPPTEREIAEILNSIGYEKIQLTSDPFRIQKSNSNVQLDLSAIAKGYAVDLVSEWLVNRGFVDHVVEIGGEVRTSGYPEKDRGWKIGIQVPTKRSDDEVQIGYTCQMSNRSMASSGNYRNYRMIKDRRFGHTIDPKTGQPIQTDTIAVSVWSKRCANADAYATAFMTMQPDKILELAESIDDLEVLVFILSNDGDSYEIMQSSGCSKYLIEPFNVGKSETQS